MVAERCPGRRGAHDHAPEFGQPGLRDEAIVDVVGPAALGAVVVGGMALGPVLHAEVLVVGADQPVLLAQQGNQRVMRRPEIGRAVEVAQDDRRAGPDQFTVSRDAPQQRVHVEAGPPVWLDPHVEQIELGGAGHPRRNVVPRPDSPAPDWADLEAAFGAGQQTLARVVAMPGVLPAV